MQNVLSRACKVIDFATLLFVLPLLVSWTWAFHALNDHPHVLSMLNTAFNNTRQKIRCILIIVRPCIFTENSVYGYQLLLVSPWWCDRSLDFATDVVVLRSIWTCEYCYYSCCNDHGYTFHAFQQPTRVAYTPWKHISYTAFAYTSNILQVSIALELVSQL